MTHDDFIEIKCTAGRALRDIANWAEPEEKRRLRRAEYLLAELRSAAQWLCDPNTDADTKRLAAERLVDVFGGNPYPEPKQR